MTPDQHQKIQEEGIRDVLKNALIMRIGMADNNSPYVVPVNFGYDENNLYFHSKMKGKKLEIMEKNPSVCFELDYGVELMTADEACKWDTRFRSVVGYGTVKMLTNIADKTTGFDAIMKKYAGDRKFTYDEKHFEHAVVMCITISEMKFKESGNWLEKV